MRQHPVNRASLAKCMEGIQHHVAYNELVVLQALNFKKVDGGWLLVAKATKKGGGRLVTFIGAHTPEECLEEFEYGCTYNGGIKWKPDLYEGTGDKKR